MSKESIVERILADAAEEAQAIISEAEQKAENILSEAREEARRDTLGIKAETAAKVKSVFDGRAAAARLDGAKAELWEKRRVIDAVYENAYRQLCKLSKSEAVPFADALLKAYAEEGDEIAFSSDYPYVQEVLNLSVVKEKKIKFSSKLKAEGGGFILSGKSADKDLSFRALLAADREQYQAEIALKIFKG